MDKEITPIEFFIQGTLVSYLITLHRFNSKKEFILNADQIKTIEETPDTVITLITNEKVLVHESAKEIVRAAIEYSRAVRTPVDYLSQPHF